MQLKKNTPTLFIAQAGVIAALYTVLTLAIAPFSYGAIQCRISEALCVLVIWFPAAVPGMTLGCFVSNLLNPEGMVWADLVFGTLATFIGVFVGRLLRKTPWLVPLPTVLANTLIIPFVLSYAYHVEDGILFLMLTVCVGEVIAAYGIGGILILNPRKLFTIERDRADETEERKE